MRAIYFTTQMMTSYVNFVCDIVPREFYASMLKSMSTANFGKPIKLPLKHVQIPVKLNLKEKLSRSAIFEVESLGYKMDVLIYLSRQKDPEVLLEEIRLKVNHIVDEIITQNKLDREEIANRYNSVINALAAKNN